MKKEILFCCCLFSVVFLMAQETTLQPVKVNQQENVIVPIDISSASVEVASTRVSYYHQLDKKLMNLTVGEKIPASVPKYIEGQSDKVYSRILLKWAKQNTALLEKSYQLDIHKVNQFEQFFK